MIPIDEMLDDLRDTLKTFESNPNGDTFSAVQCEQRRIDKCCEDELWGEDE